MITVQLKNPPNGAELWQLQLTDWDITIPINQIGGLALVDIAEPITFEVPGGLTLPLRIVFLQVSKWNEDRTALIVLYEMQSYRPYLWDWDLMDYGEEPDPAYREVFVPSLGSYYYYIDLEEMILTELAPPPTQDWLAIIAPILVLGLLAGLVLPMMKGGFK